MSNVYDELDRIIKQHRAAWEKLAREDTPQETLKRIADALERIAAAAEKQNTIYAPYYPGTGTPYSPRTPWAPYVWCGSGSTTGDTR